jgi:hypothetical protein
MDLIATVIEVDPREGFSVIRFSVKSADSAVYVDGSFGMQVGEGHTFEVGQEFNLVTGARD